MTERNVNRESAKMMMAVILPTKLYVSFTKMRTNKITISKVCKLACNLLTWKSELDSFLTPKTVLVIFSIPYKQATRIKVIIKIPIKSCNVYTTCDYFL